MSKSALVVDDDPGMLALTERWLVTDGYQVRTISDFKDAKALLRLGRVDLLLVDVRLGEFNGLQLAIEARAGDPDVRIIVMSGWNDGAVDREAAKCGAVVLPKPFTAETLRNAIHSTVPR